MTELVIKIEKGRGRRPWRVKLYGRNGEQMTISQGYSRKWNAKRAARRMFPDLDPVIVP